LKEGPPRAWDLYAAAIPSLQRKTERKQLGETDVVETQAFADLVVTHDKDWQPRGFDFHDFGK